LLSAHSIILMRYFILVLALLVTGCASYSPNLPSFKPYKLDIQQGNVVTPKMMLQLRPGMTKAQVSFIMGTPLLTDSFHADRWDYFYQMNREGKVIEQRRVILEFEGDSLSHVRGDVIPTGNGDESMTVKPITEPKADWDTDGKPGRRDEKSWLDKLKFWGGDEKAKPAAEPKVEPESKPEAEPVPVAVPAPEPAAVQEEKPSAKPTEEKKGWLDKLKFWGSDEKAKPVVEPKVEPQVAPEPVPAPAVEAAPESVSAPVEEPKVEAVPEPAPVAEPMAEPAIEPKAAPEPEPAAKVESAPEPAPAPVAEPKAEVAPEPAPEPVAEPKVEAAPAPEPVAKPAVEPKVAPQPEPAPAPKAAPAAQPKVETKPAKPVPQAEKVAPQPKDLPSEDAPDYFEKMLEKIGF
jgi:outer membrane protein assembly factor BamE